MACKFLYVVLSQCLQGNILYATRECDSHSLFMELSRLLFDGTPDLHLANFLHMVTTMAESGSNEEQTEYFILNNQKVPKLPDDESVWYIPSSPSSRENYKALTSSASTVINQQNPMKNKRKPGINLSWPPVDWKTAPGFSFARAHGLQVQVSGPPSSSSLQPTEEDDSEDKIAQKYHVVPIEINADLTKEVDPSANTTPVMLPDSEASEDRGNLLSSDVDVAYDSVDVTVVAPSDNPNTGPSKSSRKDQLFEAPNPQQVTGRLGELVAFNYFSSNFGKTIVRWVNEYNETGLPYDIVIGEEESSREYIEVKATKFERKNWFSISLREWQFAIEQGESFSIAHVSLLGNMARITIFKNPAKLCQLGKLQLAVVMPKHQQEFCVS